MNNYYRWSGSGPDAYRDPETICDVLPKLIKHSIFSDKFAQVSLMQKLPDILGKDISSHIEDMTIDADILSLHMSSTAWATQLRLLQTEILTKISKLSGYRVTQMRIYGPKPPSWRFGPKHISGRGPRDTYG